MSEDEIQRKMEFIIDHQAQFAVNIQKLEEADARASERMSKLETGFVSMFNFGVELREAQRQTQEAQRRTDESLAKLTERVKEVTDRLDNLILVVEQYISGNGRKSD